MFSSNPKQWFHANVFSETSAIWIFFAITLILGVYTSLTMRNFSLPDESAHYLRALEVSQFHLVNTRGNAGVLMPCEEYKFVGNANGPIANYIDVDAQINSATALAPCRIKSINTAGTYSPILYMFSAPGFAIADVFGLGINQKHTLGRMFNAIGNCIIIFSGLLLIQHYRALLTAVSLLPMAFWLRSSLSADAVAMSLCFLFFCFLIRCVERKAVLQKPQIMLFCFLGVVVGLTKPLYAVLPFSTLILLTNKPSDTGTAKWFLMLLIPGLASTITAIILAKAADPSLIYLDINARPAEQVSHILHHPIDFLAVFLRTLFKGANDWYMQVLSGYAVNTKIYGGMIILLCITSATTFSHFQRIYLAAIAAAIWLASSAALYLTYTPVGYPEIWGLQGRLFIPPAMIGLVALACKPRWMIAVKPLQILAGYILPLFIIMYCLRYKMPALGL